MFYKGQTVIIRSTSKDGQVAPWANSYSGLNGIKAKVRSGPDEAGFYYLSCVRYPYLMIRNIYLFPAYQSIESLIDEIF